MARRKGSTGEALWELMNTAGTLADFTKAWAKYRMKANFLQLLQAYDMIAGLAEADVDARERMERIVFLPATMTRDEWVAMYGHKPITSVDGADA